MKSLAHERRSELERHGEYVVRANGSTGWFAIFPATWERRGKAAREGGRIGPNLVVYRTRSSNPRDHHVIPNSVVRSLLTDDTLTHSAVNGVVRWNFTLRDDQLHVSHRPGSVAVGSFLGVRLLLEDPEISLPEELLPEQRFSEGAARRILVNAYERDRGARRLCIEHHGMGCAVCGMTFAERYGPEVATIVHVHHVRPLSAIGEEYSVDPVNDLRPVCPNCHAVIHSREPCYSVAEAARLLEQQNP